METTKKTYDEPVLTVYGDVEEITLAGGHIFADAPTGVNNAYSNA